MGRKITTSRGWTKRIGTNDPTTAAFHANASRALADAPWQNPDWREELARRIGDTILEKTTLPPAISRSIRDAVAAIVRIETEALAVPESTPADLAAAVAHRSRLHRMLTFKHRADELLREWITGLRKIMHCIIAAMPAGVGSDAAVSGITVPFVELITNPADLVATIVTELIRFDSDDPFAVRPGTVLAHVTKQALLSISNLNDESARKNPHRIVSPAQSGFTGSKLVAAYLGSTPLSRLLHCPLPFQLTNRFSHHHIVATPGAGKTNLIGVLLAKDLDEVARGAASVIVLDSQGDFIRSIVRIKDFAPGGRLHHRLVYIDATGKN